MHPDLNLQKVLFSIMEQHYDSFFMCVKFTEDPAGSVQCNFEPQVDVYFLSQTMCFGIARNGNL